MLIDTGYPGLGDRDVNRVLCTIKQAPDQADYLLVTHYHDHASGNAASIAAPLPVGTFIDHGRRSNRIRRPVALSELREGTRTRQAHARQSGRQGSRSATST